MTRQCGDCQLCCRLLPVRPLNKLAGQRCQHQKHHKGCKVYNTHAMPMECSLWNCRWLVNDDTADLSRPDRAHYVIDIMPDYVTLVNNETGERHDVEVVQVWCDPKYPDAHRDPALRRYLTEVGAAIVRTNSRDAVTLLMTPDGWVEKTGTVEEQHTPAEIMAVVG